MNSRVRKLQRYFRMLFLVLCLFTCSLCSGHTAYAKTKLWNYGDQLTGTSKEVYKGLQKVPNMKKYYGKMSNGHLISGKGIQIKLSKPYPYSQNAKLVNETMKAVDAFLRDRSDLFWISTMSCKFDTGKYPYKISSVKLYPVDYYDGIRNEITSTQKALKKAINYVKKRKGRYAKVKAAHDYVANLITYSSKDTESPYRHTITGGLLDKYDHRGVCEAYAKLFDAVCKANNIPSILVTDMRINGNMFYSSNHMWNYVQMDDSKWYVVDVTFDDPITYYNNQYVENNIIHDYFLVGSNTKVWGRKIKETHLGTGYSILHIVKYSPFKLPKLSKKSYISTPQIAP